MIGGILRRTPLYRVYRNLRLGRELMRWTPADQRAARFYAQFLRAGDLCLDVGANVGRRTKVFRRLGAEVIAIEPQPGCARVLRSRFPGVDVVEQALGAASGRARLAVAESDTLSSMSPAWVRAVRTSGRFARSHWSRSIDVPVTTLDALLARAGAPAFIKIDVEGYEDEVLRGLTRPVPALSFEFTPEFLDGASRCFEHLATLGKFRANYALREDFVLQLPEWAPGRETLPILEGLGDTAAWGDVYVRFD